MAGVLAIGFVALTAALAWLAIPGPLVISRDGTGPDDLLSVYPFSGKFKLSTGDVVKVPFHAFDSHATIIYGGVDLGFARRVVAEGLGSGKKNSDGGSGEPSPGSSPFTPLVATDGRAVGALWIMKYASTGIGPYTELVFTIATVAENDPLSATRLPCASTDASCVIHAHALHSPAVHHFTVKLWLDSDVAIAYGREILGIDKFPATIKHEVDPATGAVRFDVAGTFSAEVSPQSPMSAVDVLPGLVRHAGARAVFQLLSTRYLDMRVVASRGIARGFDGHAPTMLGFTANDGKSTMSAFSEARGDSISASDEVLVDAKFSPSAIQQNTHMRFALLNPHNSGDLPAF